MVLISSITFVGVGIVLPVLPSYAQGLGASATQVGLIFSGFSLSRTISAPIVGMIADKGDIKSFILVGLLLYTLIALTYVFAISPEMLIAIRIFHGIASAFILPVAMSCVALIAEKGQEGLYMGSFNMALFLVWEQALSWAGSSPKPWGSTLHFTVFRCCHSSPGFLPCCLFLP